MAHNLNLNRRTGKYSFAAKGELAWHGLGQYVTEAMTAKQAIELAQLDFTVEKRKLFTLNPDGTTTENKNRVATVRTDNNDHLGIVSPTYEIVQNVDCFNFFDALIDEGEAIYETAGALGLGERIFITAILPEDIFVKGEKISQYVLLTNGHDGFNTLMACITPTRVVCNNTLTAALQNCTNKIKISHHKNIHDKIKQAHKVMGMASKYMIEVQPIYHAMASTRISDKKLQELVLKVLSPAKEEIKNKEEAKEISTRLKNSVDRIIYFSKNHETQKTDAAKGTVWGAFNSISGYLGWVKDYDSAEDRMKDITFGTGSKQIQKAFDLCAALVK